MDLRELLGDPTWLFDLGVPILPLDVSAIPGKPERLEWELGDEFRIPPFHALSDEKSFANVSVGWNEQGLFFHVIVQADAKSSKLSGQRTRDDSPTTYLTVYLDTRPSPDVHRATSYCHRIECLLDRPSSSQIVRGHGELSPIQRARSAPTPIHPKDIAVGALVRKFGYEIKLFLRSDALTGFEPMEFQELGLFYVVNDIALGSQCMARSRNSPFFEDPSLWCIGKLIQPAN